MEYVSFFIRKIVQLLHLYPCFQTICSALHVFKVNVIVMSYSFISMSDNIYLIDLNESFPQQFDFFFGGEAVRVITLFIESVLAICPYSNVSIVQSPMCFVCSFSSICQTSDLGKIYLDRNILIYTYT